MLPIAKPSIYSSSPFTVLIGNFPLEIAVEFSTVLDWCHSIQLMDVVECGVTGPFQFQDILFPVPFIDQILSSCFFFP